MQQHRTKFFEELQRIQIARGLNRRQMERLVGVSSPGFNNWKNGATPRPETCDQVAQSLGLERNEVRSWANHPLVTELSADRAPAPPVNLNSPDDLDSVRQRLDLLQTPGLREAALRLVLNALDQLVAVQAVLHPSAL